MPQTYQLTRDQIHEPLVSFTVESFSIDKIRNELTTFGLNPLDWRAVKTVHQVPTHLTLVHRDDSDLRLTVKVEARTGRSQYPHGIQGIELMVI